jgi:hypothetical protein
MACQDELWRNAVRSGSRLRNTREAAIVLSVREEGGVDGSGNEVPAA